MSSLVKVCPWAEFLTSLWRRGVGLLQIVLAFNNKRAPVYVYSDSMPLKQIVGQTLLYNRATSWPLKACNTRSSNVPPLAWRTKWTASVITFDKLQHKAFAASAWWHSTFLAGYQYSAIHTAGYEYLRKPEESTKCYQTLSSWVGSGHVTIEAVLPETSGVCSISHAKFTPRVGTHWSELWPYTGT